MKKIFALILAIVMMASMSVVAFALDNADSAEVGKADTDESGNLGGTVLTYGVTEAYTVIIPADQTFDKNEAQGATEAQAYKASAPISASGVRIAGNQQFIVSIASANNWYLVDANKDGEGEAISANVKYNAYVGDSTTALVNDGAVLTINSSTAVAGADGNATLNFYTAGTGQVGRYQDQLTFKVAIS